MAWVADNLQQELLAADAARMAADELVRERSAVVQSLQVWGGWPTRRSRRPDPGAVWRPASLP